MKRLVLFIPLLGLAGCALFTRPMEQPIISNQLGFTSLFRGPTYETLATTADRRIVLARTDGSDKMFCTEPSPDALVTLVSSLAINAKANGGTSAAEVGAANQLAATPHAATYRSQGLSLYRDAAFNYCEALLNRAIDSTEYAKDMTGLLLAVVPLIEAEIKLLPQIDTQQTHAPTEASLVATDSQGDKGRSTAASSSQQTKPPDQKQEQQQKQPQEQGQARGNDKTKQTPKPASANLIQEQPR